MTLARVALGAVVYWFAWCSAGSAAKPELDIVATPESRAAWDYEYSPADCQLLDEIQRGCFNYFWREVGEPACLARDKTTDTVSSIAAVGFQLASLPIGVERGWVTRDEAAARAHTVLTALTGRRDNQVRGIYLHYLDADTAGPADAAKTKVRYEVLAGTVDHALFQAGAMVCGSYFGGRVGELADAIAADADYAAAVRPDDGYLSMGLQVRSDDALERHPGIWKWCSDEERLVAFLAVGAPNGERSAPVSSYHRLVRQVGQHEDQPPFVMSWNGALFTYFFSHCYIDYRHLAADNPTAHGGTGPRVDWFENTRRAVLTHRSRCIAAASRFPTLAEDRWGLAPCSFGEHYLVHELTPSISGKDFWHQGVVPPYAAGAVLPFAPREALAALRAYRALVDEQGRPLVWHDPASGGYGFVDSFRLDPPRAPAIWLGIDQGPLLLGIENARTGRVWKLFMQHPAAKLAVERLELQPRE